MNVTGNIYDGSKNIESRLVELQAVHDKFLLPEPTKMVVPLTPPIPVRMAGHERFLHMGLKRDKVFAALCGATVMRAQMILR